MVFYCCVPNCKSSGFDENISMHKFPNDERQIKVWKDRIRRSGSSATKDDFRVTASTRVCSKHFQSVDYVCPDAAKKRLKCDAVPSVFTWIHTPKRKSPRKRKFEDSDETDTASEGEERVHQEVQANIVMPCTHRFSMNNIVHSNPKLNLLRFYTGFATIAVFNTVLELIVPKKDRSKFNNILGSTQK
ncbi:52 kDa repressor of the inhibitor of the protein kinase-like [Mercenaria mercenaria]|uniref:52 kDa repressor of the inhibitor of the protein kinase-like n=1 Tax=Mercenaria mercenaria TaxID=6596 RepID=UPI00234F5363|nr:52 kDa repressor of the inhibitor of the protein kinase-like [Mercenaria mercenaria]